MNNILVTGVGGGVGQSILKSLQGSEYRTIGVDSEFLGTGLYAASKSHLVPYASHPDYVPRILEICNQEQCALVFPGLDAELNVLAKAKVAFIAQGVSLIVSDPDIVEIADDKFKTFQFLKQNGFNAPLTMPFSDEVRGYFTLPIVLKPKRGGARSQGVFTVINSADLERFLGILSPDTYVAQQFLSGDEYTCGTVNFSGKCYGTIVMKRIIRDGDTYKAFVVNDPKIHNYVKSVAEALKPFGACNFQLRIQDGEPFIFEINARCSGTTYSRTLAGFNEPLLIADFLVYGRLPRYSINEITILRYWKELVVDNSRVQHLEDHGWLAGDGSAL